ncbi:hypothetical protein PV327_008589 [Microctonus hyperodae]|uniref:Uncharacterized protein n=1 Tax=Microctonus hyperodae TaxID=165561 RepID=A0AA39KHS3_MICHY|nr:hypothetical protein PV327_008589 [Microctonus hyperodae]
MEESEDNGWDMDEDTKQTKNFIPNLIPKISSLASTIVAFIYILEDILEISAPFQVAAVALILAGTFSAMIGHCYADHKTVIACGLFLLGACSAKRIGIEMDKKVEKSILHEKKREKLSRVPKSRV